MYAELDSIELALNEVLKWAGLISNSGGVSTIATVKTALLDLDKIKYAYEVSLYDKERLESQIHMFKE